MKIKKSGIRDVLIKNAKEYCKSTTLHGLKYVANENLALVERTFFAICIMFVMVTSGYCTYVLYVKWQTAPIFVSINPTPYFISQEPFPAVTVCNLNRALKTKALEISRNSQEYLILQHLCNNAELRVKSAYFERDFVEEFIINISQPCNDMIRSCRFGGYMYDCSEVFYPVITDEGLCCIFNMLDPKFMYADHIPHYLRNISVGAYTSVNWYPEQGYPNHLPQNFTPRRALGPGESLGFSLTLHVQYDKYYCSSANGAGFKIALHSPNESPNIRETGVLIAPGMETKLRITPQKTETRQLLRSMNRKYRRCLFHDEGNLKYFAHYTQRNCEMECASKILMEQCGCLLYYMPKIYKNTNVCSIQDEECTKILQYRMAPRVTNCIDYCYPSCFDVAYFLDTFQLPISHAGFNVSNPLIEKLSDEYLQKNIAIVNMYFKENSFRSHVQTDFFTASDFLANVGGLLGFLLGASVITFVEIYYFAIIRPICSFFVRKTNKVGSTFFRKPKMSATKTLCKEKIQPATRPIYRLYRSQKNNLKIINVSHYKGNKIISGSIFPTIDKNKSTY